MCVHAMNDIQIKTSEYDIIGDSIAECLSGPFPSYQHDPEMNDEELLQDFCVKENTRVLFITFNEEDGKANVKLYAGKDTKVVYKITKFRNKYYLDWFTYAASRKNGTILIPVFVASDGRIEEVARIDKNSNKFGLTKNENLCPQNRVTEKSLLTLFDKMRTISEFMKQNDCMHQDKVKANVDKAFSHYASCKLLYKSKKGVMGLPYARMKWNEFLNKHEKYMRSPTRTQTPRRINNNRIMSFLNRCNVFPSPFSGNVEEKKLGLKLWKYMNGCKNLKKGMFDMFEKTEEEVHEILFNSNMAQILGTKIKEPLPKKVHKALREWVQHEQTRYSTGNMNNVQAKIWSMFVEHVTKTSVGVSQLSPMNTAHEQDAPSSSAHDAYCDGVVTESMDMVEQDAPSSSVHDAYCDGVVTESMDMVEQDAPSSSVHDAYCDGVVVESMDMVEQDAPSSSVHDAYCDGVVTEALDMVEQRIPELDFLFDDNIRDLDSFIAASESQEDTIQHIPELDFLLDDNIRDLDSLISALEPEENIVGPYMSLLDPENDVPVDSRTTKKRKMADEAHTSNKRRRMC